MLAVQHLEVYDDEEDDDGGQQVGDVGQVGSIESLLQRSDLHRHTHSTSDLTHQHSGSCLTLAIVSAQGDSAVVKQRVRRQT